MSASTASGTGTSGQCVKQQQQQAQQMQPAGVAAVPRAFWGAQNGRAQAPARTVFWMS
jgi:hypothetical protein